MDGQKIRVAFLCAAAGEGIRSAPYGAARVASALKADPSLEGRVDCSILEAAPGEPAHGLAERALDADPDIVGLSLYVWNRSRLLETAAVIKAARPGILIVAGGPEASGAPESLAGRADIVVAGEGELAMRSIVAALSRGEAPPGPVVRQAIGDLSALPSPWLDGTLDAARYGGAPLELTRGCPFACSFCFESKGSRAVRRFPLETAGTELAALAAGGVDEVFVLDPTFNADRAYMAQAIGLMRERGPGMRYFLELRAELIDREQARWLSSIDCAVQIGLQSSDPAVLARVNRGIDPAAFSRKLGLLEEAGVTYGLDLIYGLPGDSLDGFLRSLDYALGLGPNHLDVFRLAVLPGTELAERAGALGLESDPEAPYLVNSVPTFPRADLDLAESLAGSLDLFYNKGRAVMWLRAESKALGSRPSELALAWEGFLCKNAPEWLEAGAELPTHGQIESLQRSFMRERFAAAGKPSVGLAEAADQLIQASGAWTRALAEGQSSELYLSWEPEALLDYAPADLKRFASAYPGARGRWRCAPGPDWPSFTRMGSRRRP